MYTSGSVHNKKLVIEIPLSELSDDFDAVLHMSQDIFHIMDISLWDVHPGGLDELTFSVKEYDNGSK